MKINRRIVVFDAADIELRASSGPVNSNPQRRPDADERAARLPFAPSPHPAAGTSELQRNIIAVRVLGLPHDFDAQKSKSWTDARR